jgi:beta-lactamase regulating signal transducer with metallopeptidase domain
MNQIGMTLAWLAVQVTIFLAAALVLNMLAMRRGPRAGAWIATVSLVLVVALSAAALVPRTRQESPNLAMAQTPTQAASDKSDKQPWTNVTQEPVHFSPQSRLSLAWIGVTWDRLEFSVSRPVERVRPWGRALAASFFAGAAAGLSWLAIGLAAVAVCRRRSKVVDNATLLARLEHLRHAMGCRRAVELREMSGITTAATAGTRRPVILIPEQWRLWSTDELRAVLAHEMAHIVRHDYATGLLARVALVLNFHNPLVHLMASRLQLQQEQAADALGARFAGGRASYLLALASLALKQDRPILPWPARAFFPSRRTLMRRIAMLRKDSPTCRLNRHFSSRLRAVTAAGLISIAIGTAMLRGPAALALDRPPLGKPTPASPFTTPFVREALDGVVLMRPAAAFRHKSMDPIRDVLRDALGENLAFLARELHVDLDQPNSLKLRYDAIEWITFSVGFDRDTPKRKDAQSQKPQSTAEKPMHRMMFSSPAIRMTEPFDWRKFLEQWKIGLEEANVNGRTYFKITGLINDIIGGGTAAVYVPDDRTIILDEEKRIREIAATDHHELPAYLRSPDWERACRGLFAIAIDNRNDSFVKRYDLGRPDDRVVLSLFRGLDWWICALDDAESMTLEAKGQCRGHDAAAAIQTALELLVKMGRGLTGPDPGTSSEAKALNREGAFVRALATKVRAQRSDNVVTLSADCFSSLQDFAAMVSSFAEASKAEVASRNADAGKAKK